MVQLLSGGRLQVVIGAGYRPYEFQMFGTRREDRKQRYIEVFEVLRQVWSGEEFDYRGRRVTVRPLPEKPPISRTMAATRSMPSEVSLRISGPSSRA